jgi:hypothetical protein
VRRGGGQQRQQGSAATVRNPIHGAVPLGPARFYFYRRVRGSYLVGTRRGGARKTLSSPTTTGGSPSPRRHRALRSGHGPRRHRTGHRALRCAWRAFCLPRLSAPLPSRFRPLLLSQSHATLFNSANEPRRSACWSPSTRASFWPHRHSTAIPAAAFPRNTAVHGRPGSVASA